MNARNYLDDDALADGDHTQAQLAGRYLSGLFALPWVCGSKASYQRLDALWAKPESAERNRELTGILTSQCHAVAEHAGFIVQTQEGVFTSIELFEFDHVRGVQISKGIWWLPTRAVEPYRLRPGMSLHYWTNAHGDIDNIPGGERP